MHSIRAVRKTDMITYKILEKPEELEILVDLQASIWDTSDRNSTPHNMLMAIAYAGGLVMAAIAENGCCVGFSFAFVAKRQDEFVLWSHMTGTLPQYQGQGIGKQLKFEQRLWALDQGYKRINWTTDPLQMGNANFNIRHLGAKAVLYMVNHYGSMNDALNNGMATDRVEFSWELEDPRVVAAASGRTLTPIAAHYPPENFLLKCDEANLPQLNQIDKLEDVFYFVEIPDSINTIKRANIELAKRWQFALRQVVIPAMQQGYMLADFAREGNRGWYVLARSKGVTLHEIDHDF